MRRPCGECEGVGVRSRMKNPLDSSLHLEKSSRLSCSLAESPKLTKSMLKGGGVIKQSCFSSSVPDRRI